MAVVRMSERVGNSIWQHVGSLTGQAKGCRQQAGLRMVLDDGGPVGHAEEADLLLPAKAEVDASPVIYIHLDIPNVPLSTALWSLLVGIWGILNGSWGVMVYIYIYIYRYGWSSKFWSPFGSPTY